MYDSGVQSSLFISELDSGSSSQSLSPTCSLFCVPAVKLSLFSKSQDLTQDLKKGIETVLQGLLK